MKATFWPARPVFLILLAVGVVLPGESRVSPPRAETLRSVPDGFFSLLTLPTEPMPISRAHVEWDPAQALLLSVPIKMFLQDEEISRFYLEYIELATRYVPVVIAHDVADTRYLAKFEGVLFEHPVIGKRKERIRLAPTRSRSFWIRDNGPIFAFDSEGQLIVLDTIYRSLEGEMDAFSNMPYDVDSKDLAYDFESFIDYRQTGRNDDVSPLYLSAFIRQGLETPCDTVRPPLHLQGGDYFADGAGNAFVSEDTITANGGQRRHVELILRRYFGAKKVHILNALPGTAAKHLDMLLKPLSPSVMLYAESPEVGATSSVYNKRLSKQVGSLQEINLRYLRKVLPELRLVGVPTPPILEDSPELTHKTIRSQLFAVICERVGINYLRYQQLLGRESPELEQARKMIAKALQEAAGRPLSLSIREDFDVACQAFLGSRLDALEQFYVASTTVYRTYANSVILQPPSGETILFIPRYKPAAGESQETFDRYEQATEAAYRVAYPEATVHWIDCDSMAQRLGALHCLSMVIPAALEGPLEGR